MVGRYPPPLCQHLALGPRESKDPLFVHPVRLRIKFRCCSQQRVFHRHSGNHDTGTDQAHQGAAGHYRERHITRGKQALKRDADACSNAHVCILRALNGKRSLRDGFAPMLGHCSPDLPTLPRHS